MAPKKAACGCAKAALNLSVPLLNLRTEAIELLDTCLDELKDENDLVAVLRHVAEKAQSEKQARLEVAAAAKRLEEEKAAAMAKWEKEQAIIKAKADKEAARAAAKAEAEAAKAIAEANVALAKARSKEEADAKARAKAEEKARSKEEKAAEEKAAEEARAEERAAKAEAEEKLKAAKAHVAAKAKAAKEEDAAERKAAAEKAKAEAERAKAEAAAIAKEEAEHRARSSPHHSRSPMGGSPRSSASAISQQRLERAQSRDTLAGRRQSADTGGQQSGSSIFGALRRTSDSLSSGQVSGTDWQMLRAGKVKLEGDGKSDKQEESITRPAQSDIVDTRASQAAEAWVQGWQGGGVRATEADAYFGFLADCLTLDEDDDTLACAGGNGDAKSVSIYSVKAGKMAQQSYAHSDKVMSVAIQGNVVAAGSRDKTIRLWDRHSGECTSTLMGCEGLIHGLALRGDLLVSGEGGGQGKKSGDGGKTRQWSVSRAENTVVHAEHTASVLGVALGEDLAVSASYDTTARIWPLATGSTSSIGTLRHPSYVQSVSVEGGIAATGCADGRARVWSLASKACLLKLEHSSIGLPLFCVRLLGGVLVSGGEESTVKVWSLARGGGPMGECVATLAHGSSVKGLAISAQGFVSSGGGSTLVVWRPQG